MINNIDMTQEYVFIETIKALRDGLYADLNEMVKEGNIIIKETNNVEDKLIKPYEFIEKLSKNKYKTFEGVQKAAKKVLTNYYKFNK
jgi:hypothetical protein